MEKEKCKKGREAIKEGRFARYEGGCCGKDEEGGKGIGGGGKLNEGDGVLEVILQRDGEAGNAEEEGDEWREFLVGGKWRSKEIDKRDNQGKLRG